MTETSFVISAPRILVSTFAYNEHVKFEETIRRIHDAKLGEHVPGATVEIIAVDDGSDDGFPAKLQEKYGFTLLTNDRNHGIGYSIRRVIRYGQEHKFDILVIMAGNNKDNPDEIPQLVAPVIEGAADFVQGARYLKGGNYGNMPLYRRVATQFVHPWCVWLATGRLLHDTTNGFRAIRVSCLSDARFDLDQEWLDRYGLEYYLLYHFLCGPYRSTEVAVSKIYPPKKLGYTKIKPFQGWWDILKPLFLLRFGRKK